MKTVSRATVVTFVITIGLGAAYVAVDLIWLGNVDPKFGGPWHNFVLGMQLLLASAFVEAVGFFLLAMLFRRFAQLGGLSTLVSALVMAVTTILLWPPKAAQPFLVAAAISAIAFLAGAVMARIARFSRDRVAA